MKPISAVLALGLIALGGRAFAEEGHAHKSPHGGQVKTIGKHHVEALIKDGNFIAYLLDEKEKTVKPPDEARTVLQIRKAKHDLQLKAMGDEHLMANLGDEANKQLGDAKGKAVAIVTITIDGKPQSVRFSFSGAAAKAAAHHEEGHSGHTGDHH